MAKYMHPARVRNNEWLRLRREFENCCAYCGRKPQILHRDHVFPRCRGGGEEYENILPACSTCNGSKGHLSPLEWMFERAGWEINFRRIHRRYEPPPAGTERLWIVKKTVLLAHKRPHPSAFRPGNRCAICGHLWLRPVIVTDDPSCPVHDLCAHCYADPQEFPRVVSPEGAA